MQACNFFVWPHKPTYEFLIYLRCLNCFYLFTAGYKLNYHVLNALVLRYGKVSFHDGQPYNLIIIQVSCVLPKIKRSFFQCLGNRQGTLGFDDFIMCAIKLKNIIGNWCLTFISLNPWILSFVWFFDHYIFNSTEAFKQRDPYNTKRATFTLDEFIDKTLYS